MTEPLNWDHTYLLGWYDRTGRSFLTSWDGDLPLVGVVVVGGRPLGPPLWNAPVPAGCVAYPVPTTLVDLEARIAYATTLGGVYAFGWRLDRVIERGLR